MTIKQEFVELCKMIYVSKNGFAFPFEDLEHDDDLKVFRQSKNYLLLMRKMRNLITLINLDNKLLNKDVETELWKLI